MQFVKFFKIPLTVAIIAIVGMGMISGVSAAALILILILLEVSLSADNATMNVKYLGKLSPPWRKAFLTVGILIAVFGMRLIFPLLMVCIFGHVSPVHAIQLAHDGGSVHTPGTYGYILNSAHPNIAAFGGMFLLTLFLSFILDSEKDSHWLSWLEKPLAKAGHFDSIVTLVTLAILVTIVETIVPGHEQLTVMVSGIAGLITYILTNGLSTIMESKQEEEDEKLEHMGGNGLLVGKAALSLFLFLEVLDASFSFDGVLGAFAITSDPIQIAVGLGVGALFVRTLTLWLEEKGVLQEYEYMEHGAHWAIGVLAIMLLITIRYEISDILIGVSGMVIIAISMLTSPKNKDDDEDEQSHLTYDNHPAHDLSGHNINGENIDPVGIYESH